MQINLKYCFFNAKTIRRHCEQSEAISGGCDNITHSFLRLPRRARALLAMTFFCLASCEREEKIDRSTTAGEAIYMAGVINHKIHAEYLNNYALDATSKAKGLEQLALQYVQKQWQQNEEYIQEFGYECEKLGFKEFLQTQKLPCEKLNDYE